MTHLSAPRRRQLSLLLMAVVATLGWRWFGHDTFLVAALVAAAGLIWSSRERKAWLLAMVMVGLGIFWSSRETRGCSAWWRGQIVYQKLAGHFPFIAWSDIWRATLEPCDMVRRPGPDDLGRAKFLSEKSMDGQKWEQFHTDLGTFWMPAPGRNMLVWILWEMTVQRDYESHGVTIRAGDTVIDAGAHVGVFSAYALRQGAARVIAVEPDPTNIACLEANLAPEIASGRVVVVKAGIWDRKDSLSLTHVEQNSAQDSFVMNLPEGSKIGSLPVLPLDDIVEQLKLDHVDFIKMDIEGAERRALLGARRTLGRFKPRMAICTYHLEDDPVAIPSLVRTLQPSYQVHAKDVEYLSRTVITKVLFFR